MTTNRYGTGKYITYDMIDLGSFAQEPLDSALAQQLFLRWCDG